MKYLSFFLLAASALSFVPAPVLAAAVEPALPQQYVDTAYPALTTGHIIRNVKTSCASSESNCYTSVQSAVNAAQYGEEVVLQAGATFTESVVLPYKTGSGWIVIRTSNLAGLPPSGTRVGPEHASAMAKLVTPGGNSPALTTATVNGQPGVHNYRIVGLEITKTANGWHCADYQKAGYQSAGCLGDMVVIGYGDRPQDTLAEQPQDIILDRVYIHTTATDDYKRGVALNASRAAIIDSYISQHDRIEEGQAIAGWNGTGPYKIVNNYIEGSGENIIFGGSDARIPNAIASDVEIRGNHFFKPKSWFISHPTHTGYRAFVKNNFELKSARRVLVEDNVIDGSWAHGQDGFLVLFTPRNQSGGCTWCGIQDVTFRNNIVKNGASGVSITSEDNVYPSQSTERIKIQNNLFENVDGAYWGNGRGWFGMILGVKTVHGPTDLQFDHNTIFQSETALYFGSYLNGTWLTKPNFVFTNNIIPHNGYGVFGENVSMGNGALNKFTPGALFTKNILLGAASTSYSQYPGNYFPTSWSQVFVNQAGGNYDLASGSSYKNAGTDGKDVGADMNLLNAMKAKVVSGSFVESPAPTPSPAPVPAPTPTPTPTPAAATPPRDAQNNEAVIFASGI
jgi:hypothetical protein